MSVRYLLAQCLLEEKAEEALLGLLSQYPEVVAPS